MVFYSPLTVSANRNNGALAGRFRPPALQKPLQFSQPIDVQTGTLTSWHTWAENLDCSHSKLVARRDFRVLVVPHHQNFIWPQVVCGQNLLEKGLLAAPVRLVNCVNVNGRKRVRYIQRTYLALLQPAKPGSYGSSEKFAPASFGPQSAWPPNR